MVVILITEFFKSFRLNEDLPKEAIPLDHESLILSVTKIILQAITGILSISICLLIFLMILLLLAACIINKSEQQGNRRHYQDIMRTIKHFPYGSIANPGSITDCPICLESFNENSNIVQLKCSKYHIFHEHCIK